MKCPHCGDANSRVVDTRSTGDGIRRRRECETCHKRFTTYEHVAASLLIVKSDGRREPYDRQKQSSIEAMVDSLEEELAALGRTEVKSNYVGSLVLEHLKQLDPMAYIRFAMVYLQMSDLEVVQQHIGRILPPA